MTGVMGAIADGRPCDPDPVIGPVGRLDRVGWGVSGAVLDTDAWTLPLETRQVRTVGGIVQRVVTQIEFREAR